MSGAGEQDLAALLTATWRSQGNIGFLLVEPDDPEIEVRTVQDPVSGVPFRFRWLPHRELRANVTELERRGILSPHRDESKLLHDPRDPAGRFCFLCPNSIRECNPTEELVPLHLAGRDYWAGANFAWISANHFTVMAEEHTEQQLTPAVLKAMLELHSRTDGRFRVLYNGPRAGATIPWHLHFQIATEAFPVEQLPNGGEAAYPTALTRVAGRDAGPQRAIEFIGSWIDRDPANHSVNVLVAGSGSEPVIHIFPRDSRRSHARQKGLMGGYEVCGDLVYSEPEKHDLFLNASAALARRVLEEIRPDGV